MTRAAINDLLDAVAPEPMRALDADALLVLGRRRKARRRAVLAAPVVALASAVALVALPVIAWPDLPDAPDVAGVLGLDGRTAPVLTGRHPAEQVAGGQSPGEPGTDAVELAAAALPDGTELVLVGYQDQAGQRCTGFLGGGSIGLPSSCHPTRGPADQPGLRYALFGEQDSSHRYNGTVYAWGSAPADAHSVRFDGAAPADEVPVTTSDDSAYDSRTYFLAVLGPGSDVTGATAYDQGGEAIARRQG